MRAAVDARAEPRPARLRVRCGGALLLVFGVAVPSCSSEPPEPGFEQVGGEGGASSSSAASAGGEPSPSSSSSAGQGGAGEGASSSSSSAGSGGLECDESGESEPNGSESTATDLGAIGDCDGDGESVSGVLAGFGDVDWYRYLGSDKSIFCNVDPSRSLTASHPVRLCKYVQCIGDQQPSFSCPSGTTASTSPDGRPGCCGSAGFGFGASCGSFLGSDDMRVYFKLETEEQACVAYSLAYHY